MLLLSYHQHFKSHRTNKNLNVNWMKLVLVTPLTIF